MLQRMTPALPRQASSISNLSEARESSLQRISTDSTRSIRASSPPGLIKEMGLRYQIGQLLKFNFKTPRQFMKPGTAPRREYLGKLRVMLGIHSWYGYIDGCGNYLKEESIKPVPQ
jgi:hypothetical protein